MVESKETQFSVTSFQQERKWRSCRVVWQKDEKENVVALLTTELKLASLTLVRFMRIPFVCSRDRWENFDEFSGMQYQVMEMSSSKRRKSGE